MDLPGAHLGEVALAGHRRSGCGTTSSAAGRRQQSHDSPQDQPGAGHSSLNPQAVTVGTTANSDSEKLPWYEMKNTPHDNADLYGSAPQQVKLEHDTSH